jgi:hypothetical protein
MITHIVISVCDNILCTWHININCDNCLLCEKKNEQPTMCFENILNNFAYDWFSFRMTRLLCSSEPSENKLKKPNKKAYFIIH